MYDVARQHGHEWLFRLMEKVDKRRGRRRNGDMIPVRGGGGGGGGSLDTSRSSYLGDGSAEAKAREAAARRRRLMEETPTGDSKFDRLKDGFEMPEAWGKYKWPWQRQQGF